MLYNNKLEWMDENMEVVAGRSCRCLSIGRIDSRRCM